MTNGFISPVSIKFIVDMFKTLLAISYIIMRSNIVDFQMWGGIIVWNPPACSENLQIQHLPKHKISSEVRSLSLWCLTVKKSRRTSLIEKV